MATVESKSSALEAGGILSNLPLNTGEIIATSAFLVSVAALLLAFFQTRQNQKHYELSTKPFLNIIHRSYEGSTVGLELHNMGLGPARILNYTLEYNDKVMDFDKQGFHSVLSSIGKSKPKFTGKEFTLRHDYHMIAGDSVGLFQLVDDIEKLDKKSKSTLRSLKGCIKLVVEYECLYGNKNTLVWPKVTQEESN